LPPTSAFAGFRFPAEVIVVAVRWYLRFNCPTATSKNCSSNVASRSTTSPSTGGAQRFTPLLADTARLARHSPGHRWHHVEQYANNPIEGDHSGLKHQPNPMRGLRTDRTAYVVIAGHASR
jgi:transposase-like protein